MDLLSWKYWESTTIAKYINQRPGETRLGERVQYGDLDDLKQSQAKYVILLVPEDIGIRGNLGVGGAQSNYEAFLNAFLNIQSNAMLHGEEVFLGGYLNPEWSASHADVKDVEQLRNLTARLDAFLIPILEKIFKSGKIPVLIGGGHNNAYPLIKSAHAINQSAINVINIDAHADCRVLEGRHSGNSFSYGKEEGSLKNYGLMAWQESYNHPDIIKTLKADDGNVLISFEDLFLRKSISENEALTALKSIQEERKFGLELDVDTVEGALSSALTPLGISAQQAYHWVYTLAKHPQVLYFHLPEGVSQRNDDLKSDTMGKLLSFLVQAFIKGHSEI
ncbi:MAG TPA: arginase family protein [Chitinophagaceae bacterium]|nr:arginase family protein [Chitinophagaceae bacterium]